MKHEDCKKLEGKIINCLSEYENIKGKIIGCDSDIGITIVAADNPNRYLICLIGPSSSLWENNFNVIQYKETFDTIISQFKKRIYDDIQTIAIRNNFSIEIPKPASSETCPFGQ